MFPSQHAREAEALGSPLSLDGTRLAPGGMPIPHQLDTAAVSLGIPCCHFSEGQGTR